MSLINEVLKKRVGWKSTLPAVLAERAEFSIYYVKINRLEVDLVGRQFFLNITT